MTTYDNPLGQLWVIPGLSYGCHILNCHKKINPIFLYIYNTEKDILSTPYKLILKKTMFQGENSFGNNKMGT